MKITLLIIFTIGSACAKDWWENGNYYQIYPRSFKDSNGDGIGDLNGITEKLDYLKEIGMTGAWLSPIFQSPMIDFGYDISDYRQIHSEYGTNEDFDNLIIKAKELGIKIILDFVPNHTSDKHEWFQKSIKKIPPYSNYYIWEDPIIDANGNKQPPSNWLSVFRNSAWEWNEERKQYYLHQFAKQQPELNFRNPNVIREMNDVLMFWLEKGVNGFRLDAVPFLYEVQKNRDGRYLDEPGNSKCRDVNEYCHLEHIYTRDRPEDYDLVYQWREVCDQYQKDYGGDTILIMSEAYTTLKNTMLYYGNGVRNGSQIPFNFELIPVSNKNSSAVAFSKAIDSWLKNMPKGSEANWLLGNHDNTRIASRCGINRVDLFNILLQTLPGIAITYYGEEIGMTNVYISWDQTVDPQGCSGTPETFQALSRDPVRTPFQWDDTKNAGFTTGDKTWLPVSPFYKTINVAKESTTSDSHLNVFKKLTEIRQQPSFQMGTFLKTTIGQDILIYKREKAGSDAYIIILNFGTTKRIINLQLLFPKISKTVEIVTTSVQSEHIEGEVVRSCTFVAYGEVGTVVVSKAD